MTASPAPKHDASFEPQRLAANARVLASGAESPLEFGAPRGLNSDSDVGPDPHGVPHEDWCVSIENIRTVSTKLREIQARAFETTREAQAMADRASAAVATAEDRAQRAEGALNDALARAERAEELVRSLAARLTANTREMAEKDEVSNRQKPPVRPPAHARPVDKTRKIPPAIAKKAEVGGRIDIRLTDEDAPFRSDRRPSPALEKNPNFVGPSQRTVSPARFVHEPARERGYLDVRNEREFESLTY
ncbi:hypothetical protein [Methylorubrum podarium]|uniref:hypothetical protein n=1 Tax=Methylorubrum podarium TaxID=200476 RepID=UPI001EE221FA|nr:hypothetical protein [Methylorubrum podarium]GJE69292.1 hypothetical protein CHKEEEPN_0816 [Methylorubrum podarium]